MKALAWRLKEAARRLPPYRSTRVFIRTSERWTPERMERYQQRQLAELVRRAWRHSPGYRELLDRHGVELTDGGALDATELPRMSRALVRDHYEALRLRDVPRWLVKRKSTSGTSTGVPLMFYEDFGSVAREYAFLSDLWSRIGYRHGDRIANLRGNVVAKHTGQRPWRRYGNHLLLSSYHLTERHADEMLDALHRFRPRWLLVYPSTLYAFCRLVPRVRCRELGVRGILAGSEKLYGWQRELFEDYFDARVMHWYGMTEKTVLAGECEHSTKLHLYPQYGYPELDADEDGLARVVATSFVHGATPFIRYDVGDRVRLAGDRYCRHCGRPYPLIDEVVGREQEFVVAKSGVLLPFSEAVGSIHSGMWTGIEHWQVVQDEPGRIRFLVHADRVLGRRKIREIREEFSDRFGSELDVEVVATELEDLGPGKYRYFVQEIDLQPYLHA